MTDFYKCIIILLTDKHNTHIKVELNQLVAPYYSALYVELSITTMMIE